MSSLTTNLKLFKYDKVADGNKQFNIDAALNDNWDKIDNALASASAGIVQPDGSTKTVLEVVTKNSSDITDITTKQKEIVDFITTDEKTMNDHIKKAEIHRAIYSGTTEPATTLGADGDLYIQYE